MKLTGENASGVPIEDGDTAQWRAGCTTLAALSDLRRNSASHPTALGAQFL